MVAPSAGIVVSCPHCGTHLMVPQATVSPTNNPSTNPTPAVDTHRKSPSPAVTIPPNDSPVIDLVQLGKIDLDEPDQRESADDTAVNLPSSSEIPTTGPTEVQLNLPPSTRTPPPISALDFSEVSSTRSPIDSSTGDGDPKTRETDSARYSTILNSGRLVAMDPTKYVSKELFWLVASYASAVTILLGGILFYVLPRLIVPHALESLPDISPLRRDGETVRFLVPWTAPVARGHTMQLGLTTRFGNIRVTPLKVTRGPLLFVHPRGDEGGSRLPTRDVLKLWLRFENVSTSQIIAPLDRSLIVWRSSNRKEANTFLRRGDETLATNLMFHFDIPVQSEFQIVGQSARDQLNPGESLETFVPSEELNSPFAGPYVWRIQFRKGFGPAGYGVTTLIDVEFHADQIAEDSTAVDQHG